ncbi:MAG: DUF1707 domain-containing protein [Micromonosporaceae bacterium]|nr:DUF1707 domain-containing protein [Micromonosporaceae bacterium]
MAAPPAPPVPAPGHRTRRPDRIRARVGAVDEQLPERAEVRISDADRDRAVQRLHDAVAEGRLTMPEFEQRVDGVLQARTGSEVAPYLADLPATLAGPEHAELRATASDLKRTGRWLVPRRLSVFSKAGSVKLDLTEAVLAHPVVELVVEVHAGSTTVVLPRGASVYVDQIELVASVAKVHRRVQTSPEPVGTPHVVVTGKQRAGKLVVRHQRRFLRWRW